jgi:hypothetical protein
MSELAAKTLELAMADLGVTEIPHGSNRGPEVDLYLRAVGLDPEAGAYPWCAAWVCTKIQDAANALSWPLTFRRSASCKRLIELNYLVALAAPIDGCVFVHLQADGHGHAGFVVEARPDGSIATLEDNSDASGSRTGGSVCKNVRSPGFAQVYLEIR